MILRYSGAFWVGLRCHESFTSKPTQSLPEVHFTITKGIRNEVYPRLLDISPMVDDKNILQRPRYLELTPPKRECETFACSVKGYSRLGEVNVPPSPPLLADWLLCSCWEVRRRGATGRGVRDRCEFYAVSYSRVRDIFICLEYGIFGEVCIHGIKGLM